MPQTAPSPPGSSENPFQTAVIAGQQGGNQINTATLAAAAGKTTYLRGIIVVVGGATAALAGTLTITGLLGGTITLPVVFQIGALVAPMVIEEGFDPPLPASAVNTAIAVALSAGGAGNTVAGVMAWGFQQ